MASRTVHLILKTGPEWKVPVEAWTTKRPAEARAKELDTISDKTHWMDKLSHFEVVPIQLKEQK